MSVDVEDLIVDAFGADSLPTSKVGSRANTPTKRRVGGQQPGGSAAPRFMMPRVLASSAAVAATPTVATTVAVTDTTIEANNVSNLLLPPTPAAPAGLRLGAPDNNLAAAPSTGGKKKKVSSKNKNKRSEEEEEEVPKRCCCPKPTKQRTMQCDTCDAEYHHCMFGLSATEARSFRVAGEGKSAGLERLQCKSCREDDISQRRSMATLKLEQDDAWGCCRAMVDTGVGSCWPCAECGKWFHSFCLGIVDEEVETVLRRKDTIWYCPGCGASRITAEHRRQKGLQKPKAADKKNTKKNAESDDDEDGDVPSTRTKRGR